EKYASAILDLAVQLQAPGLEGVAEHLALAVVRLRAECGDFFEILGERDGGARMRIEQARAAMLAPARELGLVERRGPVPRAVAEQELRISTVVEAAGER